MSNVVPLSEHRPPDKDALEKIRRQVADRVKEEASTDDDGKPGGDDGGIDSKFIRDCLMMNEVGDGMLFRELHRKQFVFNKTANMWMNWSGHHWDFDHMGKAKAAVEKVVEAYAGELTKVFAEMKELDDDSKAHKRLSGIRDTLTKRIWALRSTKRRENCLTMAHTIDDPLAIKGDELDQNPWLLACKNCVIDLRTGKARPGRQDDYLLKASDVEWKGIDEPCERWENFLRVIFEEDQLDDDEDHPVTDFMQRLLGYSIIGAVILHIFPVFTGIGRNGKGTIVKVLQHIMGRMAAPIRPEMLLDTGYNSNAGGPTPHIMSLRGIRMAFASETNDNCRISAAEVKRLTGGDQLTGRAPHDKGETVFDPTETIFLLTNSLPHASAEDFAFWERMLVVDFPLSFVSREPTKSNERRADKDLHDKLVVEASGILAWLVKGCLIYQRLDGLDPPQKVKLDIDQYRTTEDNIGAFIDVCCVVGEQLSVGATELYEAFVLWWKKYISKNEMKQKKFGMLMRKRFTAEKVGGVYRYYGIGLLDTAHTE